MEHITDLKARELLKKYSPSEDVYNIVLGHSERVREIALEVADKVLGVDKEFISTASILHDIGRFKYPPGSKDKIRHGIEGANILRDEGLPEHALVCERHIGIGISKEEIDRQGLDLPRKDYIPISKEEMIIAYADNLDCHGRRDEKFVEDRFSKEIGERFRKKVEEFHKKINMFCTD